MDLQPTLPVEGLDLEAFVEDLDETMHGSFSTAGSFSSAACFTGGTFSSAACFSSASS